MRGKIMTVATENREAAAIARERKRTITLALPRGVRQPWQFPTGVSDVIRRGVSANATSLGFRAKDWE